MQDPTTDPYSPPSEWLEAVELLTSEAVTNPRAIVSISLGRSAYKPVVDVKPTITRLDSLDGRGEVVTLEADGIAPGGTIEFATSLYATTCQTFLDARRGDNSAFVRLAKVRLQIFDSGREVKSESHQLSRDEFADEEQGLFAKQASTGDIIVTTALRMIGDHAKTVGHQFVALAKQCNDQAASERQGLLDYAKGALDLMKEASDIRAASLAELAETRAGAGVWGTEAGQLVLTEVAQNVGAVMKVGTNWMGMKVAQSEAALAKAERAAKAAKESKAAAS